MPDSPSLLERVEAHLAARGRSLGDPAPHRSADRQWPSVPGSPTYNPHTQMEQVPTSGSLSGSPRQAEPFGSQPVSEGPLPNIEDVLAEIWEATQGKLPEASSYDDEGDDSWLPTPSPPRALSLPAESSPTSIPQPRAGGLIERLRGDATAAGESTPASPMTDFPPNSSDPDDLLGIFPEPEPAAHETLPSPAYGEPFDAAEDFSFEQALPAPDESEAGRSSSPGYEMFYDLAGELTVQSEGDTGPFTVTELNTLDIVTGKLSEPTDKRPEEVLEELKEKMAQVALEFAEGTINQAQFQAIYARYREQRAIIERMLANDPDSDAWQQVVTSGSTGFLRKQYEALVVGYALYDNETSVVIKAHGQFNLEPDLLVPMLSSFRSATNEIFGEGMKSTQIEGGRWLVFVPGEFTTAIVIFSLEPAAEQLRAITDLHRSFETANHRALAARQLDPDLLIYPQRTLFEDE